MERIELQQKALPPLLQTSSTLTQHVGKCVQCGENVADGILLRCEHMCHKSCLDKWFDAAGSRSCPRCGIQNCDLVFTRPQETFFRVTQVPEFDIVYKPVNRKVRPEYSLIALLIVGLSSGMSYSNSTNDVSIYPLVGMVTIWTVITGLLKMRSARQSVSSLKMIQTNIPPWLGSRIHVDFSESVVLYALKNVLNISMLVAFSHAATNSGVITTTAHFTTLAVGFVASWIATWPTLRFFGELSVFSLFGILRLVSLCIPFDPTDWLIRAAQKLRIN